MDLDALEEIFTPHEKKSYVMLLRKGPLTVFELSKETGIARAKLYEVCERLVRKGLLEVGVGKNKKVYVAKSPNNILTFVEERFRSLEETRYRLAEIVPDLEKIHAMGKGEGEMVTVIKGEPAIINHFETLSETVKDAVVVAKALAPTKYTGRWERWLKSMKDRGSRFRAVYDSSQQTKEVAKIAGKLGFEIRFSTDLVGKVDWAVYDKRIFQIAVWDSSTLIQIASPEVSQVFLSVFEILWDSAEKK